MSGFRKRPDMPVLPTRVRVNTSPVDSASTDWSQYDAPAWRRRGKPPLPVAQPPLRALPIFLIKQAG